MAKARTRRPQTRRPAPARGRRPAAKSTTRTQRVGQSSRKALSPHKGDIQGVFLALFAVVMVYEGLMTPPTGWGKGADIMNQQAHLNRKLRFCV